MTLIVRQKVQKHDKAILRPWTGLYIPGIHQVSCILNRFINAGGTHLQIDHRWRSGSLYGCGMGLNICHLIGSENASTIIDVFASHRSTTTALMGSPYRAGGGKSERERQEDEQWDQQGYAYTRIPPTHKPILYLNSR